MRRRQQEKMLRSLAETGKLKKPQRRPSPVGASRSPGEAQERRRHERTSLTIPYRLRFQGKELSGNIHDIASGGLGLLSDPYLSVGTPLTLHFSFGGTCYLNFSGQVVFCMLLEKQGRPYH
ncbi:MAG: PilZ domain-containing protein, partial [Nitrospiraceae bacterium]